MRRRIAPLAPLIAIVVLAACSGSAPTASSTASPTTAPTTATTAVTTVITVITTSTTSTTSTTAPTTTTTTALIFTFPDQETAAQKLFAAWKSGDQAAAAGLGPAVDIATLFTKFAPQSNAEDRHCDNGEFGTSSCFFANGQGGVNVTVTHNADGSWSITKIDAY